MPEPIEVVAPTCVRMSFQGTLPGGRKWASVQDFSVDEGSASRTTVLEDFVRNATGLFQDKMLAPLMDGVVFTGATWLDINSLAGGGGFVGPIAGKPTTGGQSGSMAPPNVSYLMHKHCTHNRRQRTGRSFLPGVNETAVDAAGVCSGALLTGLNTRVNEFRTGISGLSAPVGEPTMAWRVVHILTYSGESVPGWPNGVPTSWNSTDVNTADVDPKVATQRRRLR